MPRLKRFRVTGLLRTGYFEFDNTMAYSQLGEAAAFLGIPEGLSGVHASRVIACNKHSAVSRTIIRREGEVHEGVHSRLVQRRYLRGSSRARDIDMCLTRGRNG